MTQRAASPVPAQFVYHKGDQQVPEPLSKGLICSTFPSLCYVCAFGSTVAGWRMSGPATRPARGSLLATNSGPFLFRSEAILAHLLWSL